MPEPSDVRRKRLLFRSRNRGMLETNLLLSAFADRHLAAMDDARMDALETLLDRTDQEIFDWVVGGRTPPPEVDGALIELVKQYKNSF